jgi:deazaflavin-dependent oxidoreductase (nitroreductase family)
MSNWNDKIIEEFRANDGRVGGQFAGAPLLLLHSIGAKSSVERINPMMYRQVGDSWAVFATKGGADTSPDWYHNLVANPAATIEVGTESVDVVARVTEGDERDEIWSAQKAEYRNFADYERKTSRQIPVVILAKA